MRLDSHAATAGRRIAVLVCLLAVATLCVRPARPTAAQAEATVRYHAGWNLVAAPSGSTLEKTSGPAYALGPNSGGYQIVAPGELIGGRAVWVFFAEDTTVTLGRTAAEYSRTLAPADNYLLLGNPSSSATLTLSGADVAFAYDPVEGYKSVSELQPGQGAFVLANTGGLITLGKVSAGAQADAVLRLQQSLTDNPTDRGNIDALGAVAAELVRNRQYVDVQAVLDDLRAAEEDGLRKAGSGPLPTLSKVQADSIVAVREAVARAKAAAAAGDTAQADTAIEAARRAAQVAADDGISMASGGDSGHNATYAAAAAAAPRQAASLAAFGALVRSAFFATGLGQAPADPFWNLANSVLTNTPPSGPIPTPVQPPRPVATPTPAAGCASGACAFTGEGKASAAGNEGGGSLNSSFTFSIKVASGQVSGQGQFTETFNVPADAAGSCSIPPVSGSLTASGSLSGATLHLSFHSNGGQNQISCGGASISAPFPDFFAQSIFNPVDVEARDGATGSAGLNAEYAAQATGSLQVTLHGGQ